MVNNEWLIINEERDQDKKHYGENQRKHSPCQMHRRASSAFSSRYEVFVVKTVSINAIIYSPHISYC